MRIRRTEFLRLMVAAATTGAKASPEQTATAVEPKEEFAARVVEDGAAALRCALGYIGDQLGIFKTMANAGPITAAELARKTDLDPRMLREWLNGMATARYIEYRAANKTYFLSKEHADILADEESSPMFRGSMFQVDVPLVSAAPKVARAFQTGKPVTASDYSPDLYLGTEREFARVYRHQLVQTWIPLLPRVQRALVDGGAAVDVGCGTGVASILLAKAFPKSEFAGYDPYAPSIKRAREHAKRAGVSDRVRFVAADSSKLPPGQFDLVTIFHTAHHLSDPVTTLTHCRQALKEAGTCFVVDFDVSLNPDDNMNLVGRLVYPMTTLYCLQDSMANNGVGLGSEFNEHVLKTLASKSGFSQFRKLVGSTPGQAYYELRS